MLDGLPYLQTLSFGSPETCTLFQGLAIGDTEIQASADLEKAEFADLAKLANAICNCNVLVRLTFDMGSITFSQAIEDAFSGTQDGATIKKFVKQLLRILDFLSKY